MARAHNKLTDTECRAASKPGMLGDGGGLYLDVKPSGAKSWAFIWKVGGKRREMGLGGYPSVKLAKARKLAAECREAVAEGRDPIAERKKEAEPTFGECADKFLASMEGQWRNAKHRAQWRMTLTEYAAPISAIKVSAIGTDDVLRVLNPIWQSRPETASRLRGRIERVLDFAKVRGWRSGENPALWRGHLKSILPARQTAHTRPLMRRCPIAMFRRSCSGFAGLRRCRRRALEFLILTAARSGEVLGRMLGRVRSGRGPVDRSGCAHEGREGTPRSAVTDRRSPSSRALHEVRISDYVFPGHAKGKPLSNMAFAQADCSA